MPRGGRPPRRGWEDRFFAALADTKLVGESCKLAGISRTHLHRQRKKDPEFARRFEEEMELQTEVLEQIAVRRAAEGSDTLMIFLLKARRPEVYRENVHHQHDHNVQGTVGLQLLDGHNPIEFEGSQRRQAAALLLAGAAAELGSGEDPPDVIEGHLAESPDS